MGLYCTRWLMGEEQLRDLAQNYWEFRIAFALLTNGHIGVEFHHFSEEGEEILFNNIPHHSRREFLQRYTMASQYFVTNNGFNVVEYINNYLEAFLPYTDEEDLYEGSIFRDLCDEISYRLNEAQLHDPIPFYEHFISMIFFDSWEPIPHYKFILYPKKK